MIKNKKQACFFIAVAILSACANTSQADCRNPAVKRQFDKEQGYPRGRKGYVVDHICALACGGLDTSYNMQYQTKSESLEKDRWERTRWGCAKTCTDKNSKPVRTVFNCK